MSIYTYINGLNPNYKNILESINCYSNGLDMKKFGSEIPRFRDVYCKDNIIQILTRYGNKNNQNKKIMYSIKSNKYFIREIPFMSEDMYLLFEFKKPKTTSFKEYYKTEKEVINSFDKNNFNPIIAKIFKKIIDSQILTKKEIYMLPFNAKVMSEKFSKDMVLSLIDREDILNVAKANGWL